jgi:hypothetical protein
MSTERKPTGDDTTAMGKLKRLCRENAALRDELFKLSDEMKSAVWRAEVKKRFGFWLSADSQVTRWRDWVCDQVDQERLNDRVESFEERYRRDNPAATEEQVRSEGIRYFMEQAIAHGNSKDFLKVFDRDLKERSARTKAELDERKVKVSERRMALLEKKAEQADKARAVTSDESLTPEEKQARYRQIFGMM